MGPAQKHATHPTKIEPFIKMVSNAQALEKLFQSQENQLHSKSGCVTVSGKPSLEVPPGTLNRILKQAGLK